MANEPAKTRRVAFSHQSISKNAIKSFNCAELTFINQGTQNVVIDGILTLVPQAAVTYPCFDPDERNETVYNIVFTNDQQPGALMVAIVKNVLS